MSAKQQPTRSRAKPATAKKAGENGRGSVRRELVENQIYEHAARLFAERGFAGTSFQDIADAVGLTRPALYYYVKSKEELLAKLVAQITQDAAAEMASIARRRDLDPAAKLHLIVKSSVRRQGLHAARFLLLIRSEAALPSDVASTHEAGRRSVLKSFARVIDQGIDEGVFRPVEARVAALGILGMNNWVAWWFQPGGRDDIESVADQLADMAVAAVRNQEGGRVGDGGPAGVVRSLRRDLDHLERLLDSGR